jgi:protease I
MTEAVKSARRVAMLIEDEFEDGEVTGPLDALRAAGLDVVLVGPIAGRAYTGKRGQQVTVELAAGRARAKDFDAVVIPGGHAPDRMRMRHAMVDLVRDMIAAGKPVAAICHGPQLLISVNALRGRTVTCWPSIAIDVKNAGGLYVDKPVVDGLGHHVARKPDDTSPSATPSSARSKICETTFPASGQPGTVALPACERGLARDMPKPTRGDTVTFRNPQASS